MSAAAGNLLRSPSPSTHCVGTFAWWDHFSLFVIQGVTGILLSLYYKPTPEDAYESILFIMNNVRFGWLMRSIHSWSPAHDRCLPGHMLRVFITVPTRNLAS